MGEDSVGAREFLEAINKVEQELIRLSTSFDHHIRHHEQRSSRTWQVMAPLLVAALVGVFGLVYKSHSDQVTKTLETLCERVENASDNRQPSGNTRLSTPRPSASNFLSLEGDDIVAPDAPESRGRKY